MIAPINITDIIILILLNIILFLNEFYPFY